MKLKVKRLNNKVKLPRRGNDLAAGIDFHSPIPFSIYPQTRVRLKLNIVVEVPPGWCLCLCNRSSMARNGVYVTWGVVDSDYRGEVVVELWNRGKESYTVLAGDRVCQGLLLPSPAVGVVEVEELSATERGDKGFGSSGR